MNASNGNLSGLKTGDKITDGTRTKKGLRTFTVISVSFDTASGVSSIGALGARGGDVIFVRNVHSGRWYAIRPGIPARSEAVELEKVA